MGHAGFMFGLRLTATACAMVALAGCGRALVSGHVYNAEGEALPGVAVTFNDEPAETLSNALGEYRAIVRAGAQQIRYSKSGYAPAEQRVDITERQSNTIPDIRMWRLPPAKGVYLYAEGRFAETGQGTVREYVLEDGTAQPAMRVVPEYVSSPSRTPRIVCLDMPRYEARLSRLEEATVSLRAGQEPTIPVWVDTGSISVVLEPLDSPEALLLEVVLESPMEPGTYGLHWGALNRETALDPRVYVFDVAPPEPVEDEEDTKEAAAEPPATEE